MGTRSEFFPFGLLEAEASGLQPHNYKLNEVTTPKPLYALSSCQTRGLRYE